MRRVWLALIGLLLWAGVVNFDSALTTKGFREYRTYSRKHCIGSDFLTNRGPIFSKRPTKMPFLLIGGAGGGGKTYFNRSMAFELNMDLRNRGFPDAWGVIACDTYPNLRDRYIDKLKKEFQGLGEFANTQDRGYHFRFYGEGMGGVYLRNLDAGVKEGRRGAEYDWGGGEEITDWNYEQFEKFIYTLRSPRPLPYNARFFNCNPDGIGHQWVKELFVPEYRDLENPFFEIVSPENFLYVPMRLEDNALYEVLKDQLEANIALIRDPNKRRARRLGDWDIYGSGRFSMFRESVHRFTWEDLFRWYGIPEGLTIERFLQTARQYGFEIYTSLDYGTSVNSISAYLFHLVGPDGRVWTFREEAMIGHEAEAQAKLILGFEKGIPVRSRIADPAIGQRKQNDKDKGGPTIEERFRRNKVSFLLGSNERVQGAATVAAALYFEENEATQQVTKAPMWRIHTSCKKLLTMIPGLPRDPLNPEDVFSNDGANHWYDSARYFLHTRFQGGVKPAPRPVYGSPAYFRELARREAEGNRKDDWLQG